MVFENCSAVHTWFMSMLIDIVFVDKDWKVLEVHAEVGPWRAVQNADAYAVIELAAGEAARVLLEHGQSLRY